MPRSYNPAYRPKMHSEITSQILIGICTVGIGFRWQSFLYLQNLKAFQVLLRLFDDFFATEINLVAPKSVPAMSCFKCFIVIPLILWFEV